MDKEQVDNLLKVIREVHSQRADDLCWMDIDRIFAAAGLPVPDRRVGDKAAMKVNCNRFIDTMCSGGGWKAYAELEARISELESALQPFAELGKQVSSTSMFYTPCLAGLVLLRAAKTLGYSTIEG